ncbi:hypothetical protein ACS0TY_008898 [Phlomoides rotata]
MAEKNGESTFDEINHLVTAPEVEEDENSSHGDSKDDDDMCSQNQMPSQKHEEEVIKKKYGGLLPKKPPLISKDHERAFFDSADWALGKVITRFSFTYVEWKSHNFALYITQVGAQKSKGPLEALRPKLEVSRALVRLSESSSTFKPHISLKSSFSTYVENIRHAWLKFTRVLSARVSIYNH